MTFRTTLPTAAAGLALVLSLGACDSFANDIDGFIDRVESDSLDQQAAVPFLITGVKEGFNDVYDATAVQADLLADVAIFDQGVVGATFPTFDEIDDGEIELTNNSVDGVFNATNAYRFAADDLLRRAATTITFTDDAEGAESKRSAQFAGNLHGGISRYFLASYYGLEPTVGGAPISDDPGAVEDPTLLSDIIPSATLYQQSIDKFNAAKAFAGSDYETRLLNSLIARNHLFLGNDAQAASAAAQGLQDGDAPFAGNYIASSQNNWYSQGGRGRTQVAVDARFNEYAQEGDSTRVMVELAPVVAGETRTFYRQAVYTDPSSSSIPFMSVAETNLIRAEALLDSDNSTARSLLNANRTAGDFDELEDGDAVDQDRIIEERDRTLFLQGQRLIDMRRFNIPFTNLAGPLTGPWRYLPIPQGERNANPNF